MTRYIFRLFDIVNSALLLNFVEDRLQEPVIQAIMPSRKHDPLFWILVAVLTSVICLVCISFIYIRRKKKNKRRGNYH